MLMYNIYMNKLYHYDYSELIKMIYLIVYQIYNIYSSMMLS